MRKKLFDFEWRNFYFFYLTGCPNCGGEQLCPCENCAPRHPDSVMWKWDEAGDNISCGHCGFTMNADGWDDLEWYRHQNQHKRLPLKQISELNPP